MSARQEAPAPPVLVARRFHRLLLLLYPASFRSRFGEQMRRDLADLARQAYRSRGLRGLASLQAKVLGDVLRSAWREHRAADAGGTARRRRTGDAPSAAGTVSRRTGPAAGPGAGSGDTRGSAGDGGPGPLDDAVQDLRFAWRTLAGSPGFTAVAVVTLALGIGANAAIFSLVDGVLLRPLPWPDSDRLVLLRKGHPGLGFDRMSVPAPEFRVWQEGLTGLDALSGFTFGSAHVGDGEEPRRLSTARVLPGLLQMLGLAPAQGRDFTAAEFEPGHQPVVIVGPDVWGPRFGSAAAAVGRHLRLDGEPYRIVGALAAGARLPFQDVQIVLPAALTAEDWADPARGRVFFTGVGRLGAGVTVAELRDRIDLLIARWDEEHPGPMTGWTASVATLRNDIVGDVDDALLTFFGAVFLVLLIACANVANLLLARGTAREREMAVRAALGAGRDRLVRQLLTESALLAAAGCAAGVALAFGAVELLVRVGPASVPRLDQVGVDLRVVGFAAGMAGVATLLFGLFPAIGVTRDDPARTIAAAGGRSSTGSGARGWSRDILSVTEVALAVVLLVGSGLLLRSVAGLLSVDPGFEEERALRMQIVLPEFRYADPVASAAAVEEVLDRVRGLARVEEAAATDWVPMSGSWSQRAIRAEDAPMPEDGETAPFTYVWTVTPGYFDSMGIEIVRGRDFTRADSADAEQVVVVTEAMARRLWSDGADALGRRVTFDPTSDAPGWHRVVGVVEDIRALGLDGAVDPGVYQPWRQACCSYELEVVARVAGPPGGIAASLRELVWAVDDQIPVLAVDGLESLRAAELAGPRFQLGVLGAMAAIALLLAAVGVYGVVSHAVGARTQEFGVRMAVGARAVDILGLVARQGGGLLAAGIVAGLLLAGALGQYMESLLFGVSAHDPGTFAGVAVFLGLVGAVATLVPARRATRVDPLEALRPKP